MRITGKDVAGWAQPAAWLAMGLWAAYRCLWDVRGHENLAWGLLAVAYLVLATDKAAAALEASLQRAWAEREGRG
jgi:hypothetical protein